MKFMANAYTYSQIKDQENRTHRLFFFGVDDFESSRLAIEKIGDWKKLEILVQNQSF